MSSPPPTSTSPPTSTLESQISRLQLALLSHLSPPPWLPPQHPHTDLLRHWDFLRLKFGSDIWRSLRTIAHPVPDPPRYKRPYTPPERALSRCCPALRRALWDVFLPGLPAALDASLRQAEARARARDPGAAREWRILTLSLLAAEDLLAGGPGRKTPGSPRRTGTAAGDEEKNDDDDDDGVTSAVEALSHDLASALSTSPAERASTAKKLSPVVRELASAAVSLRVQRDDAGDLELFFPDEGRRACGSEVVEVGAGAGSEEEEEGEETGAVEGERRGKVQGNGGEVNGSGRGGGVVGRVVWPGLKLKGAVVRKAEVMFLAEDGEGTASS